MSAFDVIEADLERAQAEHLQHLNEELFRDGTPYAVPPLQKTSRFLRAWWRVTDYCATLWKALRGVELIETDYSDW